MSIDAKKRIMFVPSDDFNFLSYTLLVTLKALACTNKKQMLRDVRKLAPISSIIGLPQMEYLIFSSQESSEMRGILPKLWAQTKKKEPLYQRITYALGKKGIVGIDFDEKSNCKCVFLQREDMVNKLIESHLFDVEVRNVEIISKMIPRIRSIKYETLMERLLPYAGTFL
jgi:hypothetical protein